MTPIQKFVDFLVSGAEQRWHQVTKSGSVEDMLTFFHLLSPSGDHDVYAFQIADAEQKSAAIQHVRLQSWIKGAIAHAVLFQAWSASKLPGDERMPSERPDRRELLLLAIHRADAAGETVHSWEIVRPERGAARLGPRVEGHELFGDGMFQGMLRPRPAAQRSSSTTQEQDDGAEKGADRRSSGTPPGGSRGRGEV